MRLEILSLAIILVGSQSFAESPSAQTQLTQALELLQKSEKTKALKLLESAFNRAQDPETVKAAAALIVEASPMNYPKRESFLKYLITASRDHADRWKWLKELGDRCFEKADFSGAEENYLQATQVAPEPYPIRYRLAWTFWNQKRKNEALSLFLDLLAQSQSPENLSLQPVVVKDTTKLWWDLGVLPASTFEKFWNLPAEVQSLTFSQLWENFPKELSGSPKTRDMLIQIRDEPRAKEAWNNFLASKPAFTKDPCFMITTFFGPQDVATEETLLACLKSPQHPELISLQRHLDAVVPTASEAFIRKLASLVHERGNSLSAAKLLAQWSGIENADASYYKLLSQISLAVPADSFAELSGSLSNERWEKTLSSATTKDRDELIARLQKVDSTHWLAYEENLQGENPSKAFLMKKAAILAQRNDLQAQELANLLDKILEKPSNPEERLIASTLKNLNATSQQELPKLFGPEMMNSMQKWLASIDRDLEQLNRISPEWKSILHSTVAERVRKNVTQLTDQIAQVSLPEGQHEMESEFLSKRADIRDQLVAKYESLLSGISQPVIGNP